MREQKDDEKLEASAKSKIHKVARISLISLSILVVIVGVVFSIYYWGQNKSLQASVNNKAIQIGDLSSELSSLKDEAKVSADETTIPIRELGISITVPNSIKDLTYSYVNINGQGSVNFSTKTLVDAYNTCTAYGVAPPLGEMNIVQGQPKKGDVYADPVIKFSTFYVNWSASQTPCSESAAFSANLKASLGAFTNSFSTIKEL